MSNEEYLILDVHLKITCNDTRPEIINDLFNVNGDGSISSEMLYEYTDTVSFEEYIRELQEYCKDKKAKCSGYVVFMDKLDNKRIKMCSINEHTFELLDDEVKASYRRISEPKEKKKRLTDEDRAKLIKEFYNEKHVLPKKNEKYKSEPIGLFWFKVSNTSTLYKNIMEYVDNL